MVFRFPPIDGVLFLLSVTILLIILSLWNLTVKVLRKYQLRWILQIFVSSCIVLQAVLDCECNVSFVLRHLYFCSETPFVAELLKPRPSTQIFQGGEPIYPSQLFSQNSGIGGINIFWWKCLDELNKGCRTRHFKLFHTFSSNHTTFSFPSLPQFFYGFAQIPRPVPARIGGPVAMSVILPYFTPCEIALLYFIWS